MNIYYVYLHLRKNTDKIFYIGKGKNNRAYDTKNRNPHWHHIVEAHDGFDVLILDNNLSEKFAYWFEIFLIDLIGIHNLCNYTNGGNGGDTLSNHVNKDIIGKKISDKCIGDLNPNKNKGYYKWWVEKYGQEIADQKREELKIKLRVLPRKSRAIEYKSWKDVLKDKYGSEWEDKYLEINKKISNANKNQERILCEFCSRVICKSKLKQHQQSTKCK